jgi:cytochrome c553
MVVFSALRTLSAEVPGEFGELQQQIAACKTWDLARLQKEVERPDALIMESDRTPVDVVWRRTWALLRDLSAMPNAPKLEAETAALNALQASVESLHVQEHPSEAEGRALFAKIAVLRRQIAFKNPLLNFDAVLFLKHNKQIRGCRHMVDQYLGFNGEKAGGVFVLEQPFSAQPKVRSLLANSPVTDGRLKGRFLENQGAFVALELDYDAQSILFAFSEAEPEVPEQASYDHQYCGHEDLSRWDKGSAHYYFRPESTYHIFRVNADGTNLRQLTDGMWNDDDPCFLPNGRIAFISERAGGQVRCGMRPLPTATLHAMMPDGGDIIQLSWHETQEWQPSVDNQGMIVYTRWDYVDRDSDAAQHPWTCYPDGRDPRSLHGNYPDRRELRPWMEMSIRAIPGSHKYVAVAAPHHGEAYGSIILLDLRQTDDRSTGQIRRVTPEVPFPESESAPGVPHAKGTHLPLAEVYGTPWPLSERYFLCVCDFGQRNYALCLLDAFGNREVLYHDPAIACLDPIPFQPRLRPPIVPTATIQAQADRPPGAEAATGTVAILNVYDSEIPLPPNTKIKAVRVVNIFPKDNPFQDEPKIGYPQALCRGVLGIAPVAADGSAHFKLPAGAPVYFQLLDEAGLAVQTMRSDTYVHPGETLACAGCHESRHRSPWLAQLNPPLALRGPPVNLAPEVEGGYPITFPRLVQPVLDAKCVSCHDREQKAPSLRGDRFVESGWSEAYRTLKQFAWGRSGGNGVAATERQYSLPEQDGARVSRLYQILAQGHHDVNLSPNEMRRITLWLDCNSSFYGAYTQPKEQARGEVIRPRWGLPKGVDYTVLAGRGLPQNQ